ncbi:SDR family NAD(P)-dependent oxidoreductase [Aeromicrobium sp. P5_D10]
MEVRRLEGKVAVITGTGPGIARQVALRFAAEGAKIVGCDIDPVSAEETVRLVRAGGGEMESLHPVDLTVEEDVHRLFEFAVEKFGGVDIVDCNAMQLRIGAVEDLSLADWSFTIEQTMTVPFLTAKHAIPHLRARGGGSMILMGSVSGMNIGAGYVGNISILGPYAVAKAGVIRLATMLANELAIDHIRVNTISPGCVSTPNGLAFYGDEGSEERRVTEGSSLISRLATPDDIASAAVYLSSDDASFVTGHNLVVDGGYIASGSVGRPAQVDIDAYQSKREELSVADHWDTSGARR